MQEEVTMPQGSQTATARRTAAPGKRTTAATAKRATAAPAKRTATAARPATPTTPAATATRAPTRTSAGPPTMPAALCVLGMGLIGGSLMRAAAPHLPVFGWSRGEGTRAAAARDGYETLPDIETALKRASNDDALVVLAAPATAFRGLLHRIREIAPTVRLTDVAGVKAPVAALVAELAPRARYIGSHPMTGTEQSGWDAGSAALFEDRVWVTTLGEDGPIDCWLPIAALALTVGSRVVPATATAHDDAAARISHLPHLLADTLAAVGRAGGPLALAMAAGSFTDGTRVAATRPELVRAMCEGNTQQLVHVLDEALGQLGVARASLASSGSLAKLTAEGHASRLAFDARFASLRPVTLRGDAMAEQLLSVGAAGGYVTAVGMADDGLTVEAMYPSED